MPNDDGGVMAKLAGAKKALSSAESFTKSTGDTGVFTPKPSYSQARKARPSSGIVQEAGSAGEGIKAKMESEDAARKSIQ